MGEKNNIGGIIEFSNRLNLLEIPDTAPFQVNPLPGNALFLYPLKTDVFKRNKNETLSDIA